MVRNRTLLASFLVLAVLSIISTSGAFSGSFEMSDLCVDSPFQKDAMSTMNSTVSCRSHFLLTNSNLPPFKVSSSRNRLENRPTSFCSWHASPITLAHTFLQSFSSMRTRLKSNPYHASSPGPLEFHHQSNLPQARAPITLSTSHSRQAPTTELQTCTFRSLTPTKMTGK